MTIRTKQEATLKLKNLLSTSQSLLNARQIFNEKLEEVKILEKDSFIGLRLDPEQEKILNNKKGYEMVVKFIERIIEENKIDNVDDFDEFIGECVEAIFLDKKEVVEERKFEEKKREEKKFEEIKFETKIEEKKAEEKKEELPLTVHDENVDPEVQEDFPRARVPYAWKNGKVFEGGMREQKRISGIKKFHPKKEYRGWNESK